MEWGGGGCGNTKDEISCHFRGIIEDIKTILSVYYELRSTGRQVKVHIERSLDGAVNSN